MTTKITETKRNNDGTSKVTCTSADGYCYTVRTTSDRSYHIVRHDGETSEEIESGALDGEVGFEAEEAEEIAGRL
jgi:hypothetical protein